MMNGSKLLTHFLIHCVYSKLCLHVVHDVLNLLLDVLQNLQNT